MACQTDYNYHSLKLIDNKHSFKLICNKTIAKNFALIDDVNIKYIFYELEKQLACSLKQGNGCLLGLLPIRSLLIKRGRKTGDLSIKNFP